MYRFKLIYFVIFIINLYKTDGEISDKRFCVDEKCSVPISLAKTLIRYSSPDSRILSFAINSDVTIYSKSAGSNTDLWGVEINGKRGYAPKNLLKETKILQKPTLLVDTELNNDTETTQQVPSEHVVPNTVQEPYEVVDGTTIYLNPDEINPSSTESPVQSTALPASDKTSGEETQPLNNESEESRANPDMLSKISDWLSEAASDQEDDDEDDNDDDEASDELEGEVEEENVAKVEEIVNEAPKEEIISVESASAETPKKEIVNVDPVKEETVAVEPPKEEIVTVEPPKEEIVNVEPPKEETVATNPPIENILSVEPPKEEILAAEIAETENFIPNQEQKVHLSSAENTVEKIVNSENVESQPETIVSQPENTPLTEPEQPILATIPENPTVEVETTPSETIQTENIATNSPMDEVVDAKPETPEFVQNEPAIPDPIVEETSGPTPQESILSQPESVPAEQIEITTPAPELEQQIPLEPETITENPVQDTEIPTLPPFSLFNTQKPLEPEPVVDNSSEINDLSVENTSEINAEPEQEAPKEPIVNSAEEVVNVLAEESVNSVENVENNDSPGVFSGLFTFFGGGKEETVENTPQIEQNTENVEKENIDSDNLLSKQLIDSDVRSCDAKKSEMSEDVMMSVLNFNPDLLMYLVTTAASVIIFLFGYIAFDKNKREGPLIAKINKLEKELLIQLKENENLEKKTSAESGYEEDGVSSEVVENLKYELMEMTNAKLALEEQIQSLEKELENSTEVGMELNRMLSEILKSDSGSDGLKANVEHLQRQLVEQQGTINSINETLAITNTENHELNLQLELSNKKVVDLQSELDKLLQNILNLEEEKDQQQLTLESEIDSYKKKYQEIYNKYVLKEQETNSELTKLKQDLNQAIRNFDIKVQEYETLKSTLNELKSVKNDETILKSLLETTEIKAELKVLQNENKKLIDQLRNEEEQRLMYEKKEKSLIDECEQLKTKYDEADKLKMETETKLQVLANYFKDKEAQLQKEISKHESMWVEKQGEATSTTERIKFMQEQLQNYKEQTESLKQEIMNQEVELKSQISVLEKKVHENWVTARHAERKLEDAKQEAAQLRNALTLRERALQDEKGHRMQSPLDHNGDIPESPASPPLLFGTRAHVTKSPPIPGLPFLPPPPPGVPFMPPPPHGVPPFMPPPPAALFPGDHRPPPLGRMSSPPINRYSPSSRGYSPSYDRNSSSASDSEYYGSTERRHRGYSPFNSKDYKRPPPVRNGRKGMASSASGNSNESLEKINNSRHSNNKV